MSILQDIYDEAYHPDRTLSEMPEDLKKGRAAFDADMKQIGGDEVYERHWDTLCAVEEFTNFTNFREGFRLGVLLMLELRPF